MVKNAFKPFLKKFDALVDLPPLVYYKTLGGRKIVQPY